MPLGAHVIAPGGPPSLLLRDWYTEAEDIKKRWQEYTELYQKIFMTQIITTV